MTHLLLYHKKDGKIINVMHRTERRVMKTCLPAGRCRIRTQQLRKPKAIPGISAVSEIYQTGDHLSSHPNPENIL